MTLDDVKAAVDAAIGNKVILTYPQLVLFVILSGVAACIGSYLKKKGEGLATQEDVNRLTEKVETIRTTYVKQVEDYKAELARRTQATKIAELLTRFHYQDISKQMPEFMQPGTRSQYSRSYRRLAFGCGAGTGGC